MIKRHRRGRIPSYLRVRKHRGVRSVDEVRAGLVIAMALASTYMLTTVYMLWSAAYPT